MRWLVLPIFENDNLEAVSIVEVEAGAITYANLIEINNGELNEVGMRMMCGGTLVDPAKWQPVPYDVFNSLGGTMNNTIIRLVDKGYIGRKLTWVQRQKLIPEGYCKHCAGEHNLWCEPIVGTDKKLYCNRCLKPFEPIPFKFRK